MGLGGHGVTTRQLPMDLFPTLSNLTNLTKTTCPAIPHFLLHHFTRRVLIYHITRRVMYHSISNKYLINIINILYDYTTCKTSLYTIVFSLNVLLLGLSLWFKGYSLSFSFFLGGGHIKLFMVIFLFICFIQMLT